MPNYQRYQDLSDNSYESSIFEKLLYNENEDKRRTRNKMEVLNMKNEFLKLRKDINAENGTIKERVLHRQLNQNSESD